MLRPPLQGSKTEVESLEQLLANAEARVEARTADLAQLQGALVPCALSSSRVCDLASALAGAKRVIFQHGARLRLGSARQAQAC